MRTGDGYVIVVYRSPDGLRLGLYAEDGFGRNLGLVPEASPPITRTELYLQCEELPAVIERALAAGARPLSPLGPRLDLSLVQLVAVEVEHQGLETPSDDDAALSVSPPAGCLHATGHVPGRHLRVWLSITAPRRPTT